MITYNMTEIAAVIKTRNEADHIEGTLQSILNQDLKPYRVIAVNDGSTDRTKEIISKFPTVELINNPAREQNHLAGKELAAVMNQGLQMLHGDTRCEFIWMLDGDLLFPSNYTREITNRMQQDNVAISSGTIRGESSDVPRGGGRIVDCRFWKRIGTLYPINYGFDGYLVLKAASMGFATAIYKDIIFTTQRSTGANYDPQVYFNKGLAYRALGYVFPYALAASFFASGKQLAPMVSILRGYFSFGYDELYEKELRDYVYRTQMRRMLHVVTARDLFHRIFS